MSRPEALAPALELKRVGLITWHIQAPINDPRKSGLRGGGEGVLAAVADEIN